MQLLLPLHLGEGLKELTANSSPALGISKLQVRKTQNTDYGVIMRRETRERFRIVQGGEFPLCP
jgi:hypothetical protein